MPIDRITLYHVSMPLVAPFETSFGVETDRHCILVRVEADGLIGWGECPAEATFGYSYETTTTVWHALKDFLVPQSLGKRVSIDDAVRLGEYLRGHNMARHGLETALWDITAQQQGISLAKALGGTRDRVAVGVSVGIQANADALIKKLADYLAQGYGRIKIKIKPGYDLDIVRRVRAVYPNILLQVDANSAYRLADRSLFEAMDEYGLLLIEQPFGWDDIYEHSKLQPHLKTPICLDESIHSVGHAQMAIELGACKIINIKPARVGGFTESRRIHDVCQSHGQPVWCGGMLETGIGRAGNVALASLPNFTLPGDISASNRYYIEDIAEPAFTLNPDSTLSVPTAPGLGVTVNTRTLEKYTLQEEVFSTQAIHPAKFFSRRQDMALLLEKQSIPDLGHFEVEVKVSADIKVTAQTARKKVQRFLMDEVSLQIWADWPTLVLSDRLVWRVPVYLSLPGWGNLGQVGSVDVDAETGDFSLTAELRAQIEQRALNLAGKYPPDRVTIHETPANYQVVGHESE